MTGDMEKLTDLRDALLLAEVAAWLHDMGKCTDPFINDPEGKGFQSRESNAKNPGNINPHKAIFEPKELQRFSFSTGRVDERLEEANHQAALWRGIQNFLPILDKNIALGVGYTLRELIYFGRPGFVGRVSQPLGKNGLYSEILGRCHGAAHVEKEEPTENTVQPSVFMSSPFGFEVSFQLGGLTTRLHAILGSNLYNRTCFLEKIDDAFKCALGDTRRPTNEVTLGDWSFVVAALYKTAIARVVLTNDNIKPNQMSWKLFSVRFAGLEYLQKSHRISDILVRREIIQDALDKVKILLEEKYPLAMEAYRDENGSIFVFPDLDNILAYQDKNGDHLIDLILKSFGEGTVKDNPLLSLGGEVLLSLNEDNLSETWHAQLPDRTYELPPIGAHLSEDVFLQSNTHEVSKWWSPRSEELCVVCGLRPQGYGAPDINEHYHRKEARKSCPDTCQTCKAIERKVCWICEERRADRSMEWAKGLKNTIWIDEVADANGRISLIVGFFDSVHWMEGTMIKTLAVDVGNGTAKTKNPSFARIRRVWDTTRCFWQDILPTGEKEKISESEGSGAIGHAGHRLAISGRLDPDPKKRDRKPKDTPGPYHAYTLSLGNTKLSVVWDPKNQRFITAHNLEYLAEPTRLGEDVEGWLKTHNEQKIEIEEPTGYGFQNKIWGTIKIDADTVKPIPDSTYTPAIPILAEPRTFMALVPADKALGVVSAINEKYEHEMGKVRNRLPLHLGVVFAPYKTPLRSIMDAGRRMLKPKTSADGWEVAKKSLYLLPGVLHADPHFAAYVRLELIQDGRSAVWHVPLRMGDGKTKDEWYPYVFVKHDKDGNPPDGRKRMFEAPCPWNRDDDNNPQLTRLVHAEDLRCRYVDENGNKKAGDTIYFTPATVDFQWLDTSGRRFEIAYDNNGSRLEISRRPYLLNEFETLQTIWDVLSDHLTSTQIHALRELIAAKREEWRDPTDPKVFQRFCRDAITNVEWKKNRNGKYPWALDKNTTKQKWLNKWENYAVLGWLDDAIELHMQIMKEKPKYEKERSP